MEQFSSADSQGSQGHARERVKIGQSDDGNKEDDLDVAQIKSITTTMTMETTTKTGGFVQLPPELLTLILTNLDERRDLLTCRRVNKTWMILTSNILRQNCRIGFDGNSVSGFAHQMSSLNWLNCRLKRSKKVFDTLDYFPCVHFEFCNQIHLQYGGRGLVKLLNFERPVIQDFFDLYGPFIQSLNLSNVENTSIRRLLIEQVPNIKSLKLDGVKIKLKGSSTVLFDKTGQSGIKLPHLQKLYQGILLTEEDQSVMEKIIAAAPNLKIYHLTKGLQGLLRPLEMLVSKGKLYTLKKIDLLINQRNIELCEQFAHFLPMLESLSWYIEYQERNDRLFLKRATVVINKILQSSKDTLTTIDPFCPVGWVPGITIPVLDKVKSLNIENEHYVSGSISIHSALDRISRDWVSSYWINRNWTPRLASSVVDNMVRLNKTELGCYLQEPIFPPGLHLSTVFPNVASVNFDYLNSESDDFWAHLFPFNLDNNTWPSVQTVTINCRFENDIHNLSRLFSSMKQLIVDGYNVNFDLICRGIFEHLKQLEFLEFIHLDCTQHQYPIMDSVMTGFSHKTCRNLDQCDKILEDAEADELRENLSILELTGLKHLKLEGVRDIGSLVLTRLSSSYAFRRMHLFKITVKFTEQPRLRGHDFFWEQFRNVS